MTIKTSFLEARRKRIHYTFRSWWDKYFYQNIDSNPRVYTTTEIQNKYCYKLHSSFTQHARIRIYFVMYIYEDCCNTVGNSIFCIFEKYQDCHSKWVYECSLSYPRIDGKMVKVTRICVLNRKLSFEKPINLPGVIKLFSTMNILKF